MGLGKTSPVWLETRCVGCKFGQMSLTLERLERMFVQNAQAK